ncbi:MAG: hypothetical protein ABFS16_07915 [Bacteroidota bacterium]
MTPKAELFGRIEDYCLEQLDAKQKLEFEKELEFNEDLKEEVELQKEIQAAITELDVLNLKDKLSELEKQNKPNGSINGSGSFELLEELSEFNELKDELSPEELINYYDSLPKVHAYQHELTSNENIHHYYKEQNKADVNGDEEEDLNGFDMEGLDGMEDAILETDILNLRETLEQVAKTVEPQYSVEEIDAYLNGELSDSDLAEFEMEFAHNESLQDEVLLHKDIEVAVEEGEIMDLRSEIRQIMESETSWNVSEKSIEDFIDGILEEEFLAEFEAELDENTDLIAEVSLRSNVNEAITENDVQSLRNRLNKARVEAEEKETKSMILPRADVTSLRFWRNSVAMIILLIGMAGVLNIGFISTDKTYDKFYNTPTWSSERSVESTLSELQEAQLKYQDKDWLGAINVFENVNMPEKEMFVPQFYTGSSYQNLNNYEKAIAEYTGVINHADNMFVEEAEWYRALCYLKLNKTVEAEKELLAVIERKGHFEKDAKAIIRRLKYSFK